MKNYIFAVYDTKSELFHTPMFFKTKPEALRAFTDEANRPESALFKHPHDYSIFLIGDYDIETGRITPVTTPQSLGLAIEFQKQEINENQNEQQLDPTRPIIGEDQK